MPEIEVYYNFKRIVIIFLGLPKIHKDVVKQWPTDRRFVQQVKAGAPAPEDFNWIDHGAVTTVKDQGQCGSCAAFATAAALDSCFYRVKQSLYTVCQGLWPLQAHMRHRRVLTRATILVHAHSHICASQSNF